MFEEKRQFTVEKNQTLLLWPRRRHGGLGSYDPDTQFYWLHFSASASIANRKSREKIAIPQCGTPRRPARLLELFHRYLHDFHGTYFPGPAADLLACEILLEAGDIRDSSVSPEEESLAARAKAAIDAGFHRKLSPGCIASSLGYSLDYLGAKFQSAYDRTLGQYLGERRMEEARLLLREKPLRIKEIAGLCGFTSEQYFCRAFRKHEGVSPAVYRSLHSRIYINVH